MFPLTGDKMTERKIQLSTLLLATALLTGVLFIATNANKKSALVTNQFMVTTKANEASNETVVINELMADNKITLQGPDGSYTDWIELFNKGESPMDLSGMYLTDDISNPKWQFPAGTIIKPHGYLLVWADGNPGAGLLHTDFKLRANGEMVALLARDGTVIDFITFGKQIRDVSYGRMPDGSQNWSYLATPTPGKANRENARVLMLYSWPVWVLIATALAFCIAVLLVKNKKQAEVKKQNDTW